MSEPYPIGIANLREGTKLKREIPLVALAGQPNTGKSTLFNLLTGLNQHVGNWPGKTIERREGTFQHNSRSFRLIDLPGTYSLTANSPEELIAREFILREQPDLVIALVSAANLERSLYLVAELISLPTPLVVALNMMDVAELEGYRIDVELLQAALGVPVVPVVATRAQGVRELLQVVEQVLNKERVLMPRLPEIRADHRQALKEIQNLIHGYIPAPYPLEWAALKLLEGDAELTRLVRESLPPERWEAVHEVLRAHDDALMAVASGRYEWINRILRAAVTRPPIGQIGLTERIDRFATHPILGLVILALVLGGVFWVTFTLGSPLQEWLEIQVVERLAEFAATSLAAAPTWLQGLVVDGIIGGVGSVITFLPILVIFFAAFGLLEDIGYMARAAYVMDNFMHLMGLHGKSFLPLFLGFGCNVPAVMGTRVIDSWSARLVTILIAPFVPCTARMAVVAFLAGAFFERYATLVSWGLALLALSMLVVSGVLLNALLFRGKRSAFIMEMPLYHIPNSRTIALLVWQRTVAFVKKAGTVILAFSVLVWVLSVLPGGELEGSFLARFGKLVEPVGRWMGFDWRLTVALLTSFLAKENAVATLGVVFGAAEEGGLSQMLLTTYSPAVALAFLTATMLFIPCAATLAVIKQEAGSWRWALVNLALMLALSVSVSSLVYWLARSWGW
ncbi:MAG: ferrous iron transport protein B [Anaerolineales bacterium]|nr:ferrous iron transport protein B [Anaerolineales bacterium]MCS7248361.1 ferrous iron transport protein B [Anaerolineales bacterium]MDW8162174.1 ferrous iron transport protein B [Anaerolineales bacterium]MDW8446729.1 ferrous iron transport protein B [Anaerolineales bacterium]